MMPSAVAVLRLRAKWNLVGCMTGFGWLFTLENPIARQAIRVWQADSVGGPSVMGFFNVASLA
jgi:hypothetical protein